MFCHKCGSEVKDGSKFCKKCGTPLNDNESAKTFKQEDSSNKESIFTNNKKIIIGAIIVIMLIVAGALYMTSGHSETLGGTTINIPSNAQNITNNPGDEYLPPSISYSTDKCNCSIVSLDDDELLVATSELVSVYDKVPNNLNVTIYKSDDEIVEYSILFELNGTHYLFVCEGPSAEDVLQDCDNFCKLNSNLKDFKLKVATASVDSDFSIREEDQITSDGWNPKEHEVSRVNIGDGNQRVTYDDGYFRIVDKNGNIISYGY